MNLFCFSIDGLQNAMLGTYGNAWIQTPALNRLAAQSVVFDRFYTNSLNCWDIFNVLFSHQQQNKANSTLVTDDSDVFLHPRFADFSKKQLLETSFIHEPVYELEDSQFFKAAASAIDLFRANNGTDKTSLCWLHLQGFRGVWDFPNRYREIHRDDEDPEPYNSVVPPNYSIFSSDDLQAVMEAYSGGVAVLDDVVAGLLNLLEGNELSETVFVLMGTRGFSLGEHNQIGANDSLYGENLHLPLFIRFPHQEYAAVRIPQLIQMQDLTELFQPQNNLSHTKLLQCIREENVTEIHKCLYFCNESKETAVLTPEWFLRTTEIGQTELYVKLDDRFEFNNVVNRQIDVAEELLRHLKEYWKICTD